MYKIERFLGSGGNGNVYKVINIHTQEFLAIKAISSDLKAMFHLEVQALRKSVGLLYVVQIYDSFQAGKYCYIVMEYCALGDLRQAREMIGTAIEPAFHMVAMGMSQLHSQHIYHGDLKPGNILLHRDRTLRVADLGGASIGTTSKNYRTATAWYAAPGE